MAPLPPNNTAVYFVDYVYGAGQARTLQVRYQAPETEASVAARVAAYLDDLRVLRPATWVVTGARNRPIGSNVTLPSTAPTILGGTAPAIPQSDWPRFVSWVGRGRVSGRRVRLTIFGLVVNDSGDYRFQPGEHAPLDTVRNGLNSNAPNVWLTVQGDTALWNPYTNVGYNSYYERKARVS